MQFRFGSFCLISRSFGYVSGFLTLHRLFLPVLRSCLFQVRGYSLEKICYLTQAICTYVYHLSSFTYLHAHFLDIPEYPLFSARCEPGEFFDLDYSHDCEDCPLGQYQPLANKWFCLSCEIGKSTSHTRSVNETECRYSELFHVFLCG